MTGNGVGFQILSIVAFGPAVALTSYLAFNPPGPLHQLLAEHAPLRVAATILCAAVVAYGCRRVAQALLHLCGFR